MGRGCKLQADYFCYVCGFYISPKQVKHNIAPGTKFCTVCKAFFRVLVGDQDKFWAPHVCCGSCPSILEGWLHGIRKCMPFSVPRIWRDPRNHHNDCYFCMIDIRKYKNIKNRRKLKYPSIPSSIASVLRSDDLPIPYALEPSSYEEEREGTSNANVSFSDEDTEMGYHLNQEELDNLIREVQLLN